MIRSVSALIRWLSAGATIAKAFAQDAPPSWVVVETGEPIEGFLVQMLDRDLDPPLDVVQRDLLGHPYQLGLRNPRPGGRR